MLNIDDAKMNEASRWLDKAITLEKEGKSARMVDMALDKAVAYEREALGQPPITKNAA